MGQAGPRARSPTSRQARCLGCRALRLALLDAAVHSGLGGAASALLVWPGAQGPCGHLPGAFMAQSPEPIFHHPQTLVGMRVSGRVLGAGGGQSFCVSCPACPGASISYLWPSARLLSDGVSPSSLWDLAGTCCAGAELVAFHPAAVGVRFRSGAGSLCPSCCRAGSAASGILSPWWCPGTRMDVLGPHLLGLACPVPSFQYPPVLQEGGKHGVLKFSFLIAFRYQKPLCFSSTSRCLPG